MKIHYLQHVPFEGPGIIEEWAKANKHQLSGTHLFNGEELPRPGSIDGLVVMGGPMGVHDEQEYPWLIHEKKLIKKCIDQKKKVLGVCLGAQLLADVLGTTVASMPHKEIGWFPIHWTRPARQHPLFNFLPPRQTVLHWHGDRFQLPEGALHLADSTYCKQQGFLVDEHVLGLQFHLEVTQEGLGELIRHGGHELVESPSIQDAKMLLQGGHLKRNHEAMEQLLCRFFVN